ncbi:MAG: UDP-glucose/GDP-mannose dehydrogenase family protein [Saprospiraceae bacterium]|nr:UDP-glucose/GDP-mannose dehydrogenase family protein [Saprospiraceae bacterium]
MKIAVIGTGYVGLVTGTCFAEMGHQVLCIDNNLQKLNLLNEGKVPIYEPGLELLLERNLKQQRIGFSDRISHAVDFAEVIFLALPTPPNEDGSADLSFVLGVTEQLASLIKRYTVIVNKSTVPVGTAEKVKNKLLEFCQHDLVDVVSNPEFLREGVAVDDFLKPDRVVIGSDSQRAFKIMRDLYEPFVRQGNPVYEMDFRSAELTKYAANAYLATRISFMNEIANLCDLTQANVDMVRIGMGSDSRIGKRFLFPGVGYGGSCFPKDVQALYRTSKEHSYDFKILDAVMNVNSIQKLVLIEKIHKQIGQDLKNKKIAVWGLAFKPNTDDIREAPSLVIIKSLLDQGAIVSVFDPEAMNGVKEIFGDTIIYSQDMYEALFETVALVIVTEWPEFRSPDFSLLKSKMKEYNIFDGRNVYDPGKMKEFGFNYFSIGRNYNG